jgi:hypothetical protein
VILQLNLTELAGKSGAHQGLFHSLPPVVFFTTCRMADRRTM